MKFDVIAVAVDFSAPSLAALRLARKLATRGTVLKLIHVVDSTVYWRGPTFGEDGVAETVFADLLRGARVELGTLAEEPRATGVTVECVVRVGRPADNILAASENASLVIIGTHGRGAIGRLFLGSVAEEVARRSAIPVLVAREAETEKAISRVLIAVDPVGPAREPVRAAASLAERLNARLEAIHAAHLPPVLPYADSDALQKMNDVLERHLAAAPALVRGLVEKSLAAETPAVAQKGRDLKVTIVTGPPADEVIRHAGPGDVIVCGTHGRTAVGRLIFGSVAARILRGAACPVLVVRPREEEAEKPAPAKVAAAGA